MNDILINLIGFTAATLTTFSFVPQFIKLLKTKETAGLSLIMMIQISSGLALWVVYGYLRKDIVLIAANAVGFIIVFCTIIIYLTLKGSENGTQDS